MSEITSKPTRKKEDPEKKKERNRIYREANREQIKEYFRQYREANKDTIRERKKKYDEEHKDELKERKQQYYELNKDRINSYNNARIKCPICGMFGARSQQKRHFRIHHQKSENA